MQVYPNCLWPQTHSGPYGWRYLLVVCRLALCSLNYSNSIVFSVPLCAGYVFSWGTGYLGQLGLGDDSSWDNPRMIRALDPAKIGKRGSEGEIDVCVTA